LRNSWLLNDSVVTQSSKIGIGDNLICFGVVYHFKRPPNWKDVSSIKKPGGRHGRLGEPVGAVGAVLACERAFQKSQNGVIEKMTNPTFAKTFSSRFRFWRTQNSPRTSARAEREAQVKRVHCIRPRAIASAFSYLSTEPNQYPRLTTKHQPRASVRLLEDSTRLGEGRQVIGLDVRVRPETSGRIT
jgi:hypothetical protein